MEPRLACPSCESLNPKPQQGFFEAWDPKVRAARSGSIRAVIAALRWGILLGVYIGGLLGLVLQLGVFFEGLSRGF